MKKGSIAKLGERLMDALSDIDYRRAFKLTLIVVPVLIWDIFYLVVEKFYDLCTYIDDVGGSYLEKFMEK